MQTQESLPGRLVLAFRQAMLPCCLACASVLLTSAGISLRAATYNVVQRDPKAGDDGPGTAERPWKSLTKAAETAGPGDIVLIRGGLYRERVLVKAGGTAERPIRFQAAPGAHVVLTGADRLTGWQRVEGDRPVYRVHWPYRFITWSRHNAHPDDLHHRLIGRCEQVAIEGYLLRQVLETSQLAPGTFSADLSNQVLLAWDPANRDLNKVSVEGSARQEILRVEGAHVQVQGLRFRFAANMAQHGAVVLAGAHDLLEDCVIERNLIIGNREGFNFREQQRTTRRIGQRGEVQIWNHDELIGHNLLAFNRDAQVWGWFDVKDNRHWPAALRSGPGIGNADNAPGNDGQKQPDKALMLEDLRLRFENNVYFAAPGQGWFEWGVPWGRHKSYASLSDFQAGLAIDSGGCVTDPGFLDILARDYRISRAAMDPVAQVYPRGPVPGVILGVQPGTP